MSTTAAQLLTPAYGLERVRPRTSWPSRRTPSTSRPPDAYLEALRAGASTRRVGAQPLQRGLRARATPACSTDARLHHALAARRATSRAVPAGAGRAQRPVRRGPAASSPAPVRRPASTPVSTSCGPSRVRRWPTRSPAGWSCRRTARAVRRSTSRSRAGDARRSPWRRCWTGSCSAGGGPERRGPRGARPSVPSDLRPAVPRRGGHDAAQVGHRPAGGQGRAAARDRDEPIERIAQQSASVPRRCCATTSSGSAGPVRSPTAGPSTSRRDGASRPWSNRTFRASVARTPRPGSTSGPRRVLPTPSPPRVARAGAGDPHPHGRRGQLDLPEIRRAGRLRSPRGEAASPAAGRCTSTD